MWKPKFAIDKNGMMNFSMILIASRKSGKTELIKHFYSKYWSDKYDFVVVFTTLANQPVYEKLINGDYMIFTEDKDVDKINIIMETNARRKKKNKKPLNVLAIFDDTNSRKQKWDKDILNIYTKGRHYNVSIVYATQSPTLVDNIWKENTDIMCIFKQMIRKNKEYIMDNILTGIYDTSKMTKSKEKKYYETMFDKYTNKKYHCMVIDTENGDVGTFKAPSQNIEN